MRQVIAQINFDQASNLGFNPFKLRLYTLISELNRCKTKRTKPLIFQAFVFMDKYADNCYPLPSFSLEYHAYPK
ncbi:hypothetical protein CLV81_1914 [Flagellimonas meridianipacifica]|uniref:Uncharacterized protein n=1 Tax=Flagellimonas meridianipacifica TaxID=1080225 RepID=A0A2T0MJX8_9FLAO|nr:hypothetical protein CLV81_1914 [Allomuricauda pacifica]